ncbi:MAG: hypothetical protein ABEJ02_00235 [Candidatus Paceibacteria bacterium]
MNKLAKYFALVAASITVVSCGGFERPYLDAGNSGSASAPDAGTIEPDTGQDDSVVRCKKDKDCGPRAGCTKTGYCVLQCQSDEDCGPKGVCTEDGLCRGKQGPPGEDGEDGEDAHCTTDSQCRPGTCNEESGLCVGPKGDPGEDGKDAPQCSTRVEDVKGGVCLHVECQQQSNSKACLQDGSDGEDCWDLDGDGQKDPDEDRNGDGKVDRKDCRGPKGDPGEDCDLAGVTKNDSSTCLTMKCASGPTGICLPHGKDGEDGKGCENPKQVSPSCLKITCGGKPQLFCGFCRSDSDCPSSRVCSPYSNRCEKPECQVHGDCSGQEPLCMERFCRSCTEASQPDVECGSGKVCHPGTGRCIPGDCVRDADCPQGQVCKNNTCQTVDSGTDVGVDSGMDMDAGTDTADAAPDTHDTGTADTSDATVDAGMDASNDTSVACNNDSDCPQGEICDSNGRCVQSLPPTTLRVVWHNPGVNQQQLRLFMVCTDKQGGVIIPWGEKVSAGGSAKELVYQQPNTPGIGRCELNVTNKDQSWWAARQEQKKIVDGRVSYKYDGLDVSPVGTEPNGLGGYNWVFEPGTDSDGDDTKDGNDADPEDSTIQ